MSLHAGAITTSTTSFIVGVVIATVSGTAILGIAAFIVFFKPRVEYGLSVTHLTSENIGVEFDFTAVREIG